MTNSLNRAMKDAWILLAMSTPNNGCTMQEVVDETFLLSCLATLVEVCSVANAVLGRLSTLVKNDTIYCFCLCGSCICSSFRARVGLIVYIVQ